MTTKELTVTYENSEDVVREIEQAFFDIPFENSKFQTESFVIGGQITPERAYRAIGLRMHAKLRALNEAKFGRMKEQVDLEEIEHKLNTGELNKFDRRREEIKREQILSNRTWTDKLINDALSELNVLYKHFKALPKYTREQFENGERLHYEQRLNRQVLGLEGAKESLINMQEDIAALKHYEERVLALENNASNEQLLMLSHGLSNLLKEKA
jgi:hypothetical protein